MSCLFLTLKKKCLLAMLLKIFLANNPAKIFFDVIVFSFWQREKFSGKVGLPVVYSDRGWKDFRCAKRTPSSGDSKLTHIFGVYWVRHFFVWFFGAWMCSKAPVPWVLKRVAWVSSKISWVLGSIPWVMSRIGERGNSVYGMRAPGYGGKGEDGKAKTQ